MHQSSLKHCDRILGLSRILTKGARTAFPRDYQSRLNTSAALCAQRVRSILDPAFAMPMGIVADRNRLTIGGANTVWEYRKMPAVAKKAGTGGQARRLLSAAQRIHVTGDNKSK